MKYAMSIVLAGTILLFGVSIANAEQTWLPDFNSATRIQLDPKLSQRNTAPVNFNKQFGTDLDALAAKHGLSVYVVATEQGEELAAGDRAKWAADMLHGRLWKLWESAPGFPKDHYVVILYIRQKDGDRGSIAARTSEDLHAKGLTRQYLYTTRGPVLRNVDMLHVDPQAALLKIVSNINDDIDAYKPTGPPVVWVVLLILGGAGLFILLVIVLTWMAPGSGGKSNSSGGGSDGGGSGCGGGGCGGGGCGGGCGGGGGD